MSLVLPILFLGLMASLSPATIVVFVLVLGTTRASVNGLAFLVGWGFSLTLVFVASYAIGSSGAGQQDESHTAVAVLETLLGLGLLVAAARLWRRRDVVPAGRSTWGAGRLAGSMKNLRPRGAFVVGVLKQPWAITTAAALIVVNHHTEAPVVAIAFVLFTVASTATVGLMFLYYARHPGNAQAQLATVRDRVVEAGPEMGAAAGLLIGAFLVVDGIMTLT